LQQERPTRLTLRTGRRTLPVFARVQCLTVVGAPLQKEKPHEVDRGGYRWLARCHGAVARRQHRWLCQRLRFQYRSRCGRRCTIRWHSAWRAGDWTDCWASVGGPRGWSASNAARGRSGCVSLYHQLDYGCDGGDSRRGCADSCCSASASHLWRCYLSRRYTPWHIVVGRGARRKACGPENVSGTGTFYHAARHGAGRSAQLWGPAKPAISRSLSWRKCSTCGRAGGLRKPATWIRRLR